MSKCQTIDAPGQPEGLIAVPSVATVKAGEARLGHAAKRLAHMQHNSPPLRARAAGGRAA